MSSPGDSATADPSDGHPAGVHHAEPLTDGPTDQIRDELPADLVPDPFSGLYEFPDNSRRRIPGVIYLVLAAVCLALFLTSRDSVLVNAGFGWAALVLAVMGAVSLFAGVRMQVDERQALVEAQQALEFPIGHASAQQVWHGLRSRPAWRVLCYSAEDPPVQRGLVLVDAVDGRVIEHLAQDNPERWPGGAPAASAAEGG